MYLEMPIRMAGLPSIYKMPKEIWLGAKPLLKHVQYGWWPPKQFKNVVIGQFDLYPEQRDANQLKRILSSQENVVDASKSQQPDCQEVQTGCFVAKNVLNLHFQQTILNSLR